MSQQDGTGSNHDKNLTPGGAALSIPAGENTSPCEIPEAEHQGNGQSEEESIGDHHNREERRQVNVHAADKGQETDDKYLKNLLSGQLIEGGGSPGSVADGSDQSLEGSRQNRSDPEPTVTVNNGMSLGDKEDPLQSGKNLNVLAGEKGGESPGSVEGISDQSPEGCRQNQSDPEPNLTIKKDKGESVDEKQKRLSNTAGVQSDRGQGQRAENQSTCTCKVVGDSISNSHVHITVKTTTLMASSFFVFLTSFFLGATVLHISNLGKNTIYYVNEGNFSLENISNLDMCLKDLHTLNESFINSTTKQEEWRTDKSAVIKQLESEVKSLKFKQSLIEGTQEFTEAKLITSDTFWFVAILLFLLELVMGLVLYKVFLRLKEAPSNLHLRQTTVPHNSQHHNRSPETQNRSPENQILSKVSRRNLQRSVCVLSFYSGTPHKNHLSVSRSFLDQGIKLEDFVVNKHEDILRVPDSKVMLVHIDYNARNIILEDPSREIGDLKRTTVLSLQKMGAEVILFYYEERSGQALENGRLYNSQLESVKIHTVLKQLESQQRVISLREGALLTSHQKRHLQSAVNTLLR